MHFNWYISGVFSTTVMVLVYYSSSSSLLRSTTFYLTKVRCRGVIAFDHTQGHTTVGRTPLNKGSARRRDLYLTTHNTHNRQTSVPSAGFDPAIPAGDRLQTLALDRSATGIGLYNIITWIWMDDTKTNYTVWLSISGPSPGLIHFFWENIWKTLFTTKQCLTIFPPPPSPFTALICVSP